MAYAFQSPSVRAYFFLTMSVKAYGFQTMPATAYSFRMLELLLAALAWRANRSDTAATLWGAMP